MGLKVLNTTFLKRNSIEGCVLRKGVPHYVTREALMRVLVRKDQPDLVDSYRDVSSAHWKDETTGYPVRFRVTREWTLAPADLAVTTYDGPSITRSVIPKGSMVILVRAGCPANAALWAIRNPD